MRRTRITVRAGGGVGGARFLRGLAPLTDPPDRDTLVYTLAGLADPVQGWGLHRDTFRILDDVARLGGPAWFRLGDRDLATHLVRTGQCRAGVRLSTITRDLARHRGVRATVLPMTDDRVRTFVHTERGRLRSQAYLVQGGGRGRVRRIEIAGAERARPAPGVLAALRDADAIVIPPSNPLVSIGPIVAIPAVRRALERRRAPAAAVCPLVGGRPVRGPLARMLRSLGHEVSPRGVAALYRGLVDVFVVDGSDLAWASRIHALGLRVVVTDTLMRTPAAARRLAARVLRAVEAAAS